MPNQGPNDHKFSSCTEGSASAALTVATRGPAPPPLVVPGGWRIEGLPGTGAGGRPLRRAAPPRVLHRRD